MNKFKDFAKKKRLYAKLLIIISLVVIDIMTKVFCATYFNSGADSVDILGGLITFTYLENTGAAFGSFSNGTIYLTIVSIVFVVAFVVMDVYYNNQSRLYTYGYTFMIAGAVGNLIDRLFLGYVRDFIKIDMFGFVCNIADICITFGVILFLIDLLLSQVKEGRSSKQ